MIKNRVDISIFYKYFYCMKNIESKIIINRDVALPATHSFFMFGPRLTGKSTILRQKYATENSFYIDLLETAEANKYVLNPGILFREVIALGNKIEHVIIDEIQKVPQLLDEVQRLMAHNPALQFVLCGSSARKLKRLHANLLGGRASIIRVGPLSSLELAERFDLLKVLDIGSLPMVYLSERPDAIEILRGYVENYLDEEIRQEALVRKLGTFIKFLSLVGAESGNILNHSNIAGDLGISYKTIQDHFQILEDTLLIRFLPAFKSSMRKQLAKHPKYYLFDVGVLRALRKELTLKVVPETPLFGIYFEHFIVNEMMNRSLAKKLDWSFSFYRDYQGTEVDLIIVKPDKKIFAVEIKSCETVSRPDIKGLLKFKGNFPEAVLYLICRCSKKQILDDIIILPWQEIDDTIFLVE